MMDNRMQYSALASTYAQNCCKYKIHFPLILIFLFTENYRFTSFQFNQVAGITSYCTKYLYFYALAPHTLCTLQRKIGINKILL